MEVTPSVDVGLGNSADAVGPRADAVGPRVGGALVVDPEGDPRPYLGELETGAWA